MNAPPMLDVRRWAAQAPEHPAVVRGERQLSCGALEALANRLAAAWRGLGVQRDER